MWCARLVARLCLVVTMAVALAGCDSKFKRYDGPNVTAITVHKAERKMYLMHGDQVMREYDIALGFTPEGHKQFEGDGKTPEGTYYISEKKPNSQYHLSLRVSYPNDEDRIRARAQGKSPGGDIFIHGGPLRPTSRRDWTAGCIAVTNEEIEEIYAMIDKGTVIHVLPRDPNPPKPTVTDVVAEKLAFLFK
ncbi:MAG: hypothetical protein RIT14_982 [Pseudomonadota bacterium]|jgi:murein L,D-transpeptidase YafK